MQLQIAVPLDGSRFSELAIPYAVALAEGGGGHVHLLHVLTRASTAWMTETGGPESRAREDAQAYLDRLAARVRDETGVAASGTLLEGRIVEALTSRADEIDADLVVMTTHGRGGLERAWLGSVADTFVRAAERPVLLIPARQPLDWNLDLLPRVRGVLVPLDGSPMAEAILTPALKLGAGRQVTFHLVRVATLPALSGVYGTTGYLIHRVDEERRLRREKQKEAAEYLRSVRARLQAPSRRVVAAVAFADDPAAALLDRALEYEVDVIAIATHGRAGVSRMVFGSIADRLIRAESPPVLVYRPSAEPAGVEPGPATATVSAPFPPIAP